jgi:PKHD-type hydroxylase
MIYLSQVLGPEDIGQLRVVGERAPWVAGNVTAAGHAAQQKKNEQVDENSLDGDIIGQRVMAALQRHPLFASAAFPSRVTKPLMNRYAPGMEYGAHFDNPLMSGTPPLRTDLSGTVFLSDPADYDGGELVVETGDGRQMAKLPPGDLALYPSTYLHYVAPVTRGTRYAAIFWVQSLVRDHGQRVLLFEITQTLASLEASGAARAEISRVAGIYHRLVQMWAEP